VSGARERICAAMLELTSSRGYNEISVEEIAARAGVERELFKHLFGAKEACAIAVFDGIEEEFERAITAAYEAEAQWPDSLRAGAYAAAGWIEEHPREVRFAAVEMLWVSELGQARREAGFQQFIGLIEAGREQAEHPGSIPAATSESVIGSIAELITKRLQHGELDPYALVPELMYLAVLPYRGEEIAARELRMAPPQRRGPDGG
jgi:AcrR family transcriptional regulator